MKRSQKGFTLIELLAVIVILAIIALIATPIVLNIINKARQSAAQDSVYGAMEAIKLAYAESLMKTSGAYEYPITVEFTDSVGAIKTGASKTDSGDTLTLSGTAPTSGSIALSDTGVFTFTSLVVNSYTCTIDTKQVVKCN